MAMPSAAEMLVLECAVPKVSYGLSARCGKPEIPPSWRNVCMRSRRPVSGVRIWWAASALKLATSDINSTLSTALGGSYVNDFIDRSRVKKVYVQGDAAWWVILNDPARYIEQESGGLQIEPLTRQLNTVKEILARLYDGRGVLLADDVGLGKTTVGAIVAWVLASQGKRVRIYAPNEVLRRRWAEELKRHVPMLSKSSIGVSHDRIKQGDVGKLKAGRIQVTTHHALVDS